MMRIDGDSLSTAPLVPGQRRCELCNAPLRFHGRYGAGCPVLSPESREALLIASSLGWGRVTPSAARAGDSSSLTRRGAGASRSWSATGSSSLVCRRLRRKKYDYIWGRVTSQLGMDTGSRSDSSRSLSVVADTTGTAALTPADDCEFGWMGRHYWDRKPFAAPGYVCLTCGREKP